MDNSQQNPVSGTLSVSTMVDQVRLSLNARIPVFTGCEAQQLGCTDILVVKQKVDVWHVQMAFEVIAHLERAGFNMADIISSGYVWPYQLVCPSAEHALADMWWDAVSVNDKVICERKAVTRAFDRLCTPPVTGDALRTYDSGHYSVRLLDMLSLVMRMDERTYPVSDRGWADWLLHAIVVWHAVFALARMRQKQEDDEGYVHRLVSVALARAKTAALELLSPSAVCEATEEATSPSLWRSMRKKFAGSSSGWPSRRGKPQPKAGKSGPGKWTRIDWLRNMFSRHVLPSDVPRQRFQAAGPVAEGDEDAEPRLTRAQKREQYRIRRELRDEQQRAAVEAKAKAEYKKKNKKRKVYDDSLTAR